MAANKHKLQHSHQVPYKAEKAKRVLFSLWHDKQCTAFRRIKHSACKSCRLLVFSSFGRLISHNHKERTHGAGFPPKLVSQPSYWSQNSVPNYFPNDNLDSGMSPCCQKVILSDSMWKLLFQHTLSCVFPPSLIFCLVTQNLKYFGGEILHLTLDLGTASQMPNTGIAPLRVANSKQMWSFLLLPKGFMRQEVLIQMAAF